MKKLDDIILDTEANITKLYAAHPSVLHTYHRLIKAWSEEIHGPHRKQVIVSLLKGIDFAAEKHQGQVRNHADWVPFIVHPLRVAAVLWDDGDIRDPELLLAALLHDVLEDTMATPEEIKAQFEGRVVSLVKELTEKPNLTEQEEIAHVKAMSKDAQTIKLADRTHSLRDLLDHPPKIWDAERADLFIKRSKNLLKVLKDVHHKLEVAYVRALEALEAHHPHA